MCLDRKYHETNVCVLREFAWGYALGSHCGFFGRENKPLKILLRSKIKRGLFFLTEKPLTDYARMALICVLRELCLGKKK